GLHGRLQLGDGDFLEIDRPGRLCGSGRIAVGTPCDLLRESHVRAAHGGDSKQISSGHIVSRASRPCRKHWKWKNAGFSKRSAIRTGGTRVIRRRSSADLRADVLILADLALVFL